MQEIRFTLIADGSSDKTLLRVIKWVLDDLYNDIPNSGVFADFRQLPRPPKTIERKIEFAMDYYPFDILFIHRDAESNNLSTIRKRKDEIITTLKNFKLNSIVCIIPVKMMETWLLIDPEAIKKASGNRKYSGNIDLPDIHRLEQESQPKRKLHDLLKQVSSLKGRNLQKFNIDRAVHLVAENITDYSALRKLKAFQVFESDVKAVMNNNNNYLQDR